MAQSAPTSAPTDPAVELTPVPPPVAIDPASFAARERVAVIGFTMAPGADERDAWLADAVQEVLCWRLRRMPALLVASTERLTQARRELQEETDPPPWGAVASALGARKLVSGVISGNPDAMRITIELREVNNPTPLAREELPPARLFAALDAATRWSLTGLKVQPPDGALGKRLFEAPCKSPSALEYYVKALTAFREERARDTTRYLRDAVDFDPAYRSVLLLGVEVDLRVGSAPARRIAAARLALLLELCRRDEDRIDLCTAEIAHGVLNGMEGVNDAAESRFARALILGREANEPYAQLAAMTSLANLYTSALPPRGAAMDAAAREAFVRSSVEKSIPWQQAIITSLEALGDQVSLAPAANRLALTYERLGRDDEALAMHQRTLDIAQRLGAKRGQATALLLIGQWNARQKRWDDALAAIQRCFDLSPEGQRPAISAARASVLRGMGKAAEALAEYDTALAQFRKSEDLTNQLLCLREIATLRWEQQMKREAIAALREAIDIAHVLQSPIEAKLQQTMDEWKKDAPAEPAKPAAAPAKPEVKPADEKPASKKDTPKKEAPAPKGAAPKKDPKKPK